MEKQTKFESFCIEKKKNELIIRAETFRKNICCTSPPPPPPPFFKPRCILCKGNTPQPPTLFNLKHIFCNNCLKMSGQLFLLHFNYSLIMVRRCIFVVIIRNYNDCDIIVLRIFLMNVLIK